jgi:hypothetical protein
MRKRTTRRPPPGRRPRRAAPTVAVVVATLAVLAGCSGEGGDRLPTALPTSLPSLTLPTVTVPSVTLPTVTLPTVTVPSVTLPTVTLPTVTGPTVPGPTVTVTQDAPDPTTEAPAPPTTEEAAPEPEETAAAEPEESTEPEDSDADGGNGWLWLLLLLLAAGAVAAVVALLRRRRARQAWAASVDAALPEAEWLRDSIVPDLIDQGPDGRAGIWVVSRPRVVGLEEDLRRLVTQAPDPALGRPVQALTTAVEALRRLLDQADALAGFGGPSVTAALHRSRAELEEAIAAVAPPVPEGEPV